MKTQTIKNNKGFTLVEVMSAILILTFTVVGTMTIVANSLFAARYARDEITANYLLQEVIDYIRNDRDTTVFLESGGTWAGFSGNYNECSNSNGCYFDVSASSVDINNCPSDGCPNLYYDESATNNVFYNYTTGIITKFKRKIVVGQNGADEIDVTVTVSWKNGSLDKTRELKTSFMNWQQ